MFEKRSSVEMCHLIDIPKSPIAGAIYHLFKIAIKFHLIKKVYYLYDIPSGAERGARSP